MSKAKSLRPYLLLLPLFIVITSVFFYPLIKTFILSFQRYSVMHPESMGEFAGLENYQKVIEDSYFWQAFYNSIIWTVSSLTLQFILGFSLALLLNDKFLGRGVYQGIVFLPWAIPPFIVAIFWRWMFNARYGLINDLLIRINLIRNPIPFLGSVNWALPSVIVTNVWVGIPFFAIMILAGLQAIPSQVLEAASIDGAGILQKFTSVTLPLLKPVIITAILLRTIWIFNFPTLIWIMTRGGPINTSQILTSYLFFKAYSAGQFDYAAALSVILCLILFIYSVIYIMLTKFGKTMV